jgi:hypothetical protein
MQSSDEDMYKAESRSCEPGLSRKEFMAMVLRRAVVAGAVLSAPKVVDKFLMPPAKAMMVTTSTRLHTEA